MHHLIKISLQVVICFTLLSSFQIKAQIISTQTITRGTVNELQVDSSGFWIYNTTNEDLEVYSILSAPVYGDTVLSAELKNSVVPIGDSSWVSVLFSPRHNIEHVLPLVLVTSHDEGAFAVEFEAQVQYSNLYYSNTQNLSQGVLRSALTNIVSANHSVLSYSVARDNMYATLDNHGGLVECVYTGRTATFNTRSGAVANNINCEHTFPQSKFGSASPMKNDIHHLFPSDQSANSSRSNHPFGVVTGTPNWSVGGSMRQGSLFEPRDAHKGDCARAMLYFVLRYGDYSNFYSSQEPILRTWHSNYSTDSLDIYRNNGIYALQSNRNPFIDYPQFLDRITTLVGTTSAIPNPDFIISEDTINLVHRPGGGQSVRRFIIANTGNVTLLFSNMAISNSGLTISSGGSSKSLESGEHFEVIIDYNTSNMYSQDSLTFLSSSSSGFSMITVPIKSKTKLDLEDRSSKNDFVVLIEGGLRILGITGDEKLELIDAQGRLIAKKELNQMPSDSFDWLTFTPRIGWLRIERKGQATICKFAHSN
ncbi:MAG: Extracellular ribonuclease [Owenweeksia sp. TMED14]|nr:MAG: Extracellular ribonuclease [Owenweeksia sp. TMED14]